MDPFAGPGELQVLMGGTAAKDKPSFGLPALISFLNSHNASLGSRKPPYDAVTLRLALIVLGAVPLAGPQRA